MNPKVLAVHSRAEYMTSKQVRESITLVAGLGVEHDAHSGKTVKHRSRVRQDPAQPNLRQVHLIHSELFDDLRDKGFEVGPGLMGENITTSGIDLLSLPTGTVLHVGSSAVVEITGLRNPCSQLDELIPGLMKAVLDRDASGEVVRKVGVMSIVLAGGPVVHGDAISVQSPSGPQRPLKPV